MKIVRKFGDFMKVRINEDILPPETAQLQPGLDATMQMEDPSNIIEEPESKVGYEEEESGDNIENEMNKIVQELNATKTGNKIQYKGDDNRMYTIEFYSEPNSFAINGKKDFIINNKKQELKTAQDVINYFNSQMSSKQELEPALEARRFKKHKVNRK